MSSSAQICFLFFRQLRKDLEDQFEVYIFAPLYIILFTSLKPALLQTLRHQSALPHTFHAEKYNNAELTRSDSKRLTL